MNDLNLDHILNQDFEHEESKVSSHTFACSPTLKTFITDAIKELGREKAAEVIRASVFQGLTYSIEYEREKKLRA